MSETKIKMEWVNSLPAMTFMDEPAIRDAFIGMNMRVCAAGQAEAETFYEKESMYLKRVIFNSINPAYPNSDLRKCSTFSLYACFQDMAANGSVLSFNQDEKLAYIEKRGYKCGRDGEGRDIWENRARLVISPYGELAIRMDRGQIKYADTPVIVYDGEPFRVRINEQGNKVVMWECEYPRKTKKIVGSFIKITRPDGSFDYSYLLQEEIDRLAAYSEKQNGQGKTNFLYGSTDGSRGIDPGFLAAKTLKHAFKAFPKVKIKGTNAEMDGENQEIDYDEPGPSGLTPAGAAYMAPPRPQPEHGPEHYFNGPAQEQPSDSFVQAPAGKPGVRMDDDTF